ncbi:MAG: hypothetical protein AMS20_08265 [Gemmatimonas sp. SG8_28]|jgi:hypothetical protein|nr:MAG: hypothetical protein AMS20_08265 [Gemmatimonas sp. SG8_28]
MQATGGTLARYSEQIFAYLPTLTGGLLVLALGVAVGWISKRVVIRILIWLRLDRLGGRVGWRAAFGKGDVRAATYEMAGSVVMAAIVLLFLDNALQIWGLTVLSRWIDQFIFYVPNLALVGLIVTVGFLISNGVGSRVENALQDEGFRRSQLLAKIVKGALQAVVGALALWQLGFAREIVLAGFLITFGAIGVAFAVAVGLGSSRAIQRGWEKMLDQDEEK